MLFVCECMRVSVYVCCGCVYVCVRVCVIVCMYVYIHGGGVCGWLFVRECGCVKHEKMCVTSA